MIFLKKSRLLVSQPLGKYPNELRNKQTLNENELFFVVEIGS